MYEFLHKIGIKAEPIRRLFNFEPVRLSGELFSHEYRRLYPADTSTARLNFRPTEQRLDFLIDGKDHVHWFREKHRQNMPEWEKSLEKRNKHGKGFRI